MRRHLRWTIGPIQKNRPRLQELTRPLPIGRPSWRRRLAVRWSRAPLLHCLPLMGSCLAAAGCTAAVTEEMGKSQPKVAWGKLISQSLQFLTRNGLECSDLETFCVKYLAVTYEDVVKIVGFALSHHLKQNKSETPANEAKLVLSSESIEHGIRMLRAAATGWSCLPIDILKLILDFHPLRDAISFGAICKEWHSAFLGTKGKLWCQRPCLMIQKRKGRASMFLSLALHALHGRGYKTCLAVNEFFYNFISSSQGCRGYKICLADNFFISLLPRTADRWDSDGGRAQRRILSPSSPCRDVCQAGVQWMSLEKPHNMIKLELDDLNYDELALLCHLRCQSLGMGPRPDEGCTWSSSDASAGIK